MKALFVLLVSTSALAQLPDLDAQPKTFAEYEAKYDTVCNGPLEKLPSADVKEFGGYSYERWGSLVKLRRLEKRKGPLKIGVLSAIKDGEPETVAVLDGFFKEFEKQDVELIVIGGDSGEEPKALDDVYRYLAGKTKKPVLTVAGNSERAAAHDYAVNKQRKEGAENLINVGVVRRVDADGFDVISLSGYYNEAFLHMRGACIYKPQDLEAVIAAAKEADDPVILLSHGPPKQSGKDAIDYVPTDGNVGDPEITKAIKTAKIAFGIHGHILEAGGKATDLAGKVLKPGKAYSSMFLNPGSANPLTWKLNTGETSYGLAAIMTIEGKNAKYEVLKAPKPVAKANAE